MVHVRYIISRRELALCEMTPTPTRRAVEAPILEPDASNGLQSFDHGQFETIAIQILSPYSTYNDWRKIVSCPNEYGQTLAHLAVTLGYTRLLEQLILWKIDLSVRDATDATALHFACLFDRPDCVSLLTRNGTDQRTYGEPDKSGVSFNGTYYQSTDLAAEHAGCITDRQETLGAESVLVPKWLREENEFDPRRARANSVELPNLDFNPRSPTIGAIGVQPPGPPSAQTTGMTPSQINGISDACTNAGSPNCQHSISSGNDAHPETSYSHINATKSTLWTSVYPDTLSAGASGTPIPSGASWLRNETPTGAQTENSDCTTDDAFLVPTKRGGIRHLSATLPPPDMSSPCDEWYTVQELESLEGVTTIHTAEFFTPQGSSPRILPLDTPSTGTPIPASPMSSSTPIPIRSPTIPAAAIPLPVASLKEPLGDSLQSLLGTNQSSVPDALDPHPIDRVHGGLIVPKPPPPEPYEFREMTLGCRFGTPFKIYITISIILTNPPPVSPVATDQWLTTRVDTTWTVSQVKLHMLTKLLGARRDQLKVLSHPGESHTGSTHSATIHENRAITTSNRSPIVFGLHESSDRGSLSYSPNPLDQPSQRPVEREPFDTKSDILSHPSFIQSVPTVYQAQFDSRTVIVKGMNSLSDLGFVATTPPEMTDLNMNKVNKEDVLDELLDRLETDAKERVHKVAEKYCLVRFLYVRIVSS